MSEVTLEAPVDEAVEPPSSAPRRRRRLDITALLISMVAVVGVSLYRVITLGFVPVAPDDAAYIGVGRALWGLREPLGVDGSLFTIRSWVYPAMMGGASRLFGDDPFAGPRVLGWTLATIALALAVLYGFRLSRGLGAIATALAILAAPLIWMTVPTTRIEVGLIASMMVLLLVMDTPTPRRMVIGGIVAGLTLLIKETSAPLVVLPLAYLGTMPRPEWVKLAARYLIAFAATVGWWFLVVLFAKGEVFPISGIDQASGRNIPRGWTLDSSGLLLVGLWIAAWIFLAITRRNDPRARILLLAVLALIPAALIAYQAGFAMRQFVPLGLLSSIMLGVAAADILTAAIRRAPRGAAQLVGAVVLVVGLVAMVPVVLTQDRTPIDESKGALDEDLANYFAAMPGVPTVLTTFWFKAQLWARTEGDVDIVGAEFHEEKPVPDFPDAVWVDTSRRVYRVLTRKDLVEQLRGAQYLVLSGPHRFGPMGLATWLNKYGQTVGLTPVKQFGPADASAWAYVYKVDNPQIDKIPTIVTSDAVDRVDESGTFTPDGPTVIAATRGWLKRYARTHPTDGTRPYQPLRSLPR